MKRRYTLLATLLAAVLLLVLVVPVAADVAEGGPIMCSPLVIGDGFVSPGNGTVHVQLRQSAGTEYNVAACAGPFELSGALTVEATLSFPNDMIEGSTGFGVQNNWFADPNGIYALQGIWFNQVGGAGNQLFATVLIPALGQLDSVPVPVADPHAWNDYQIVVSEDTPGQYVAHFRINSVEVATIPLVAAPWAVRVELWNDNQQSGQDLMPYLVPITQLQQVKAKRVVTFQP